jgi:hypothetical protein
LIAARFSSLRSKYGDAGLQFVARLFSTRSTNAVAPIRRHAQLPPLKLPPRPLLLPLLFRGEPKKDQRCDDLGLLTRL